MSSQQSQDQIQVEYRKLGNTGLRVSVPIVGAACFGDPAWAAWAMEEEKAMPILKAAWDRGLNTIDTANLYSNGASEKIIGNFIKKYEIPRNKIIFMTKCCGLVANSPGVRATRTKLHDTQEYVNQSGLSRTAIFNQVEASLARLDTSYIDVLQIHRYDVEVTAEETMKASLPFPALHDLVQSGKVRYIGASSMRTWQFAHLNNVADKNGWTKFISMQNQYSLLYREEEREMNAYCKFHGIGIIPWFALHSGFLARPIDAAETERAKVNKGTSMEVKLTDADKVIIGRVEEIARKRGWRMAQVALAWVGTKVTSPIVGMNSVQRMYESVVKGMDLSEEEIKYLEAPYVPKPVERHA